MIEWIPQRPPHASPPSEFRVAERLRGLAILSTHAPVMRGETNAILGFSGFEASLQPRHAELRRQNLTALGDDDAPGDVRQASAESNVC